MFNVAPPCALYCSLSRARLLHRVREVSLVAMRPQLFLFCNHLLHSYSKGFCSPKMCSPGFVPRGQVSFEIVVKHKTQEIRFLEITAFEFSLQER